MPRCPLRPLKYQSEVRECERENCAWCEWNNSCAIPALAAVVFNAKKDSSDVFVPYDDSYDLAF